MTRVREVRGKKGAKKEEHRDAPPDIYLSTVLTNEPKHAD